MSIGVGGVALYKEHTPSPIWYHSHSSVLPHPPSNGIKYLNVQWDCLELPEEEVVESVAVGQTHVIALTTAHNGVLIVAIKYVLA